VDLAKRELRSLNARVVVRLERVREQIDSYDDAANLRRDVPNPSGAIEAEGRRDTGDLLSTPTGRTTLPPKVARSASRCQTFSARLRA
jgi:hypothetical protein